MWVWVQWFVLSSSFCRTPSSAGEWTHSLQIFFDRFLLQICTRLHVSSANPVSDHSLENLLNFWTIHFSNLPVVEVSRTADNISHTWCNHAGARVLIIQMSMMIDVFDESGDINISFNFKYQNQEKIELNRFWFWWCNYNRYS